MAYCVKCGAKVDDGIRYCPYGGGESPLGQGQYDQQGPYDQPGKGTFHPEDVKANKVMAVLSYIGILVLVPLLAGNKNSEYLRHHINQGLVIWIGSLLADILSGDSFLISSMVCCTSGRSSPGRPKIRSMLMLSKPS